MMRLLKKLLLRLLGKAPEIEQVEVVKQKLRIEKLLFL